MVPKYLTFMFFIYKTVCFNLDLNYPIVYSPETQGRIYFGYSVVLHPGEYVPWIRIGAPRFSNVGENSGAIFVCGIFSACKLDEFPNSVQNSTFFRTKDSHDFSDAFLGGQMALSSDSKRLLFTGHKFVIKYPFDYNSVGSLFYVDLDTNRTEYFLPLADKQKRYEENGYRYGQGQAGFSLNVPQTDVQEVLLGAPGVSNWAGSAIRLRDWKEPTNVFSQLRSPRIKKQVIDYPYGDFNIVKVEYYSNRLFGYSVSSGYYYERKKLIYSASSPHGDNKLGQVSLFSFHPNSNEKNFILKESISGTQLSECFGCALASGDLNRDGLDDLIIAAPYYKSSLFNEGRVLVYLGSGGKLLEASKGHIIEGTVPNGQFGTALQYLKDLDGDGFGDLAISAPFEGNGVVYIYKGCSEGLLPKPAQIIKAEQIYGGLKGFGISFSNPVDIDMNRYRDLAIGSYLSNNAVLLRARPVVVIKATLDPATKLLQTSDKQLSVIACYSFSQHNEASISLSRTLIIDEELKRGEISSLEVNKTINVTHPITCETFHIDLKTKHSFDKLQPFTVSLSYKLIDHQQGRNVTFITGNTVIDKDRFCPRCPVLDPYRSSDLTVLKVPFTLGCGSDNICQTDLKLEYDFPALDNGTFIIGSNSFVILRLALTNSGEKSYSTQVEVDLPNKLNLRQLPANCRGSNKVLCEMGNPLEELETRSVQLDLDMKQIELLGEKTLKIKLKVLSSSENRNSKSSIALLHLTREADLVITGKPGDHSVYFNKTQKPNFTQIYQVEKFGYSPVELVRIVLKVPYALRGIPFVKLFEPRAILAGQAFSCQSKFLGVRTKRSDVEVFNEAFSEEKSMKQQLGADELRLLENRTFYINCSNGEVLCEEIVCLAGPFIKRSVAVLHFKMMLDIPSISERLNGKDIVVFTSTGQLFVEEPKNFIQTGNRPDFASVSSLFTGDNTKDIPLWIIVLSVMLGLLLLMFIVLGMSKAGFFKRSDKEKLDMLKNEQNEPECLEEPEMDFKALEEN